MIKLLGSAGRKFIPQFSVLTCLILHFTCGVQPALAETATLRSSEVERSYLAIQSAGGCEEGTDPFVEKLRQEVVVHLNAAIQQAVAKKTRYPRQPDPEPPSQCRMIIVSFLPGFQPFRLRFGDLL